MESSYTVQFSKTLGVIEYRDECGLIEFTYDFLEELRNLELQHYPPRLKRKQNYNKAFIRTKQYLTSLGYKVKTHGKSEQARPLTTQQASEILQRETCMESSSELEKLKPPQKLIYVDDTDGSNWELWLCARLVEGSRTGYSIVYDEISGTFGVANRKNEFLGFWGSFEQTVTALIEN